MTFHFKSLSDVSCGTVSWGKIKIQSILFSAVTSVSLDRFAKFPVAAPVAYESLLLNLLIYLSCASPPRLLSSFGLTSASGGMT